MKVGLSLVTNESKRVFTGLVILNTVIQLCCEFCVSIFKSKCCDSLSCFADKLYSCGRAWHRIYYFAAKMYEAKFVLIKKLRVIITLYCNEIIEFAIYFFLFCTEK